MSIKPLIILPDPVLRLVSKPVERFDDQLQAFANDMLDTMYDAPGIGLAAIQVAEPIRMVVIDLAREGEDKAPHVFVNPKIIHSSDERSIYEEGCLSIPEYYAEVERPACVRVEYQDVQGNPQEIEVDGLMATCIQHEIDHLDGVLFIDHISKLKRDMVIKKFKKIAKERQKRNQVL